MLCVRPVRICVASQVTVGVTMPGARFEIRPDPTMTAHHKLLVAKAGPRFPPENATVTRELRHGRIPPEHTVVARSDSSSGE